MPLISYFPSAGGGEEPGYSSWFGTGEDGDLTVTEDTPLDVILDEGQIIKQYNNLTITETGVLHPANRCNGMVLLVKGDLTVDGTIHVNKCAPLLNPNEDMAAQEQHIALCGALTGGKGGDGGALFEDGGDVDTSGVGVGGAGFRFGGGFGGGSGGSGIASKTCRKGANGDPRPPVGTSIPYPGPDRTTAAALYGAGGSAGSNPDTLRAKGGGGPGGSGGVTIYGSPSYGSTNGKPGDAIGGGGIWVFVQGKVRIGGTGRISATGGNGAQGAYVQQPSGSSNRGWYASGGGGGGGGGIIAIVHTGDIINQGSVTAYGGAGGAAANVSLSTYPGNDGEIGTVVIKNISELLAS